LRKALLLIASKLKVRFKSNSVAAPGCLSRIADPNFFHPESWIHIKEFKYFNPKNGFSALGNMIRFVHPGSGFRILIFITHPGSRGQKAPDSGSGGSATQLNNNNFQSGPSHGKFAWNKQKSITGTVDIKFIIKFTAFIFVNRA
jgi:hypothetical protein